MTDFRLKAFYTVAQEQSFTKASKLLFVTQPAISKHIQQLEMHFETQLLDRLGGRVVLTSAGQILYDHCERILEAYRRMSYEMQSLQDDLQGDLRLGASTTLAQYVLPPILAAFTEQFPSVKLSMLSGNSEEIETALLNHRLDLGLVEGVVRNPLLKYHTWMEDTLVAVVHSRSHWRQMGRLRLEDLPNIPLVLRERGSGTLDVFEAALKKVQLNLSDLPVRMHLGSTESIKLFMEHSDVMAIVSIQTVQRELRSGQLVQLDLDALNLSRHFAFVHLLSEPVGLSAQLIRFVEHYNKWL